jgi:23S rRNA (uracil1939-C5)-methyltransferase
MNAAFTMVQVKIEKLVYGGEGMGHADSVAVFVPFVLPGETVLVRPSEQKKKFARGRVEKFVELSPERIAAPCPYFTRCGGCHYQHIPYEAQHRLKTEILRETLSRLGKVKWEGAIAAHASPPFGYRNRTQWKARRAPGADPALGYFEGSSSTVCPIERCALLSPLLGETLDRLRGLLARREIPPTIMEVEAFADAGDAHILLSASFANLGGATAKAVGERLRAFLPFLESLLLHDASRDRFELFGPGFLRYAVGGWPYRVGHLSFFQTNRFLLEPLVARATAEAEGDVALDLFAGVGLFSLPLARGFRRVIAVEANPAATRDLEENVRASAHAASGSIETHTAEAENFLARFQERCDLVLVDPPRAGLSEALRARLLELRPEEIRYVSCDPATLARDLGSLSARYEIAGIELFDLFPQTFHLETLVRLRRSAGSSTAGHGG